MLEEPLFRVLFLSIYAIFAGIRIYYRRKSARPKNSEGVQLRSKTQIGGWAGIVLSIGILGMMISVIIHLIIPPRIQWFPLPLPSIVRWVGVVLGLGTIPFLIWIHRTLGRYYSAVLRIKEEHALITTGPYSWIRHPMYAIFILFTLSTVFITANLLITIFAVVVIIMFLPLSKKEEQMMLTQFGDEYRDYMKQTGRFFPRMRQHKGNT